jgi:hypothetical protein
MLMLHCSYMDQPQPDKNSPVEPEIEAAPVTNAVPENGAVAVTPAPAQTAEEVAESTPAPADQQVPKTATPSKQKSSLDATTKPVIVVTVIVVVVLGLLATLIYLKQK